MSNAATTYTKQLVTMVRVVVALGMFCAYMWQGYTQNNTQKQHVSFTFSAMLQKNVKRG